MAQIIASVSAISELVDAFSKRLGYPIFVVPEADKDAFLVTAVKNGKSASCEITKRTLVDSRDPRGYIIGCIDDLIISLNDPSRVSVSTYSNGTSWYETQDDGYEYKWVKMDELVVRDAQARAEKSKIKQKPRPKHKSVKPPTGRVIDLGD